MTARCSRGELNWCSAHEQLVSDADPGHVSRPRGEIPAQHTQSEHLQLYSSNRKFFYKNMHCEMYEDIISYSLCIVRCSECDDSVE